jgi:hypothetical protein
MKREVNPSTLTPGRQRYPTEMHSIEDSMRQSSLSEIESDKLSTESNVLLGSSGRSYQDGYHIDLLTAIDISDSMRRTAVKITLVKTKVDLNSSDYKKLITP